VTANVYGRLPHTPDSRDYLARASRAYTGQYVDLSGGFPDPCYDQGNLGSCVSQAVAAAMDFDRKKQGLTPLSPPSRLFIYWNGRDGAGYPLDQDTGLQVRDGFQAAHKCGAPSESDWPYDVARFADKPPAKAYTDGVLDEAVVYGAVTDIDAMIVSGYPVAIGFDVYDSFEDTSPTGVAATGIMPVPDVTTEKVVGGHCVLACSTVIDGKDIPDPGGIPGRSYRLCRNSWGHDGTWGLPGKPGYFFMPTDVMDGPMTSEAWQVTTVTADSPPVPPTPGPSPAPGGSWLDVFRGVDAAHADVAARIEEEAGETGMTVDAWVVKHFRYLR
jgi:C1A family cysteine protease